jgi:hypothetical protein
MQSKHEDTQSEQDSTINDEEIDEASSDTEKGSTASENTEVSDEEIDPDEIEQGSKNFFWREILSLAYSKLRQFPGNAEELENFEYFQELVYLIRKYYKTHKFMQLALENSKIENKLSEYADSLVEKNFTDMDAKELAWDHLKFLFKRLIIRNQDIFNDELKNREEPSSSTNDKVWKKK